MLETQEKEEWVWGYFLGLLYGERKLARRRIAPCFPTETPSPNKTTPSLFSSTAIMLGRHRRSADTEPNTNQFQGLPLSLSLPSTSTFSLHMQSFHIASFTEKLIEILFETWNLKLVREEIGWCVE